MTTYLVNHYRDFLPADHAQALWNWASGLDYRPVPMWLGNFQFRLFGMAYGRHHGYLPPHIKDMVRPLMGLCPAQTFTTVFVQRYEEGTEVFSHRDPKNNTGYTVIAPLGDYEGGVLHVEGVGTYSVRPRDAIVLPCTINGVQGPRHWLTPITKGTRYAVILNTIR